MKKCHKFIGCLSLARHGRDYPVPANISKGDSSR